jgi:hypothetical protein
MKMGIERVLMEKFGELLKEVVQVDKQEIGASIPVSRSSFLFGLDNMNISHC